MAAFFSILLFLIQPALPDSGGAVETQSLQQVQQYAQAIKDNQNPELNAWALAKVSHSTPSLRNYTATLLSKPSYSSPAFGVLGDTTLTYTQQIRTLGFTMRSPLLLVEYLLTETVESKKKQTAQQFEQQVGYPSSGPINYSAVVQALLNNSVITKDILPASRFYPLHFFLFTNGAVMRAGTFSQEYLQTVSEWNFSGSASLQQSMGISTLFLILYTSNKFDEIGKLYRPIIDDKLFPNAAKKLLRFKLLDNAMYRLGYYKRSIQITQNYSLPLSKYLNQEETTLKLRNNLGLSLYRIGKFKKSEQIYLDLKEQLKGQDVSVFKARVLNNLAINFWKSGEFNQFLTLQFQALEESKAQNNYEVQQTTLRNLFAHYRTNKDFASARQYLQKAELLAKKQQNKKDLAQLYYFKGQLYRDADADYDKAIDSFDEALSLISYDSFYRSYQNILTEKALLLEKKEKNEDARYIYQRILRNAQERDDPRNILSASYNKANTYLSTGELDSARTILDSLKSSSLDALDFYQLVKARTVQARYRAQTGQPQQGAEILQPVIEQIVQRSRGSGDLKTGFWQVEAEYLDAFELYANTLIATDQAEQAVEALDRLKTINDAALYQNPLVRSKVLNEKELSTYKRLTETLDGLRKDLLAAAEPQKDDIQQAIDKRSAQKSALDRKITDNADAAPGSVRQIQRGMNAYQRVLHITELNDTFYVAFIARTSVQIQKIPITPKMRSFFKATITELNSGDTNLNHLYAITELLGIERLPEHVNKLTIIPDSYLYQLPMDVLPVEAPDHPESYGGAEYLIERFETNYMTSLGDFNISTEEIPHSHDYAGYGVSTFGENREALVSLPQATTEIKRIAQQLDALKNKRTYVNAEATEQSFRQHAPHSRILHMATHSEVSNRDPMFSSIYLSTSGADNEERFSGRIFASELFELNLTNELIMLNSCESGSGSYIQGTGVVGISRALRYAGARALVLNLWSVNDMLASDFAIKFYEGINEGQSKSEALRKAKIHFLKTKNANPHYWGSYMLLGNEDPIVRQTPYGKNIFAASFMIFFLSLAIASSVIEMRRK